MRLTKKLKKDITKRFNKIAKEFGRSDYHKRKPFLNLIKLKQIHQFNSDFAHGAVKKRELKDICGWFDPNDSSIVVIIDNMENRVDVIKTILHEYTHYLQSPRWMTRYYSSGYSYKNHPYEKQAIKAEKKYKRFLI
jgi:hypothetical protein